MAKPKNAPESTGPLVDAFVTTFQDLYSVNTVNTPLYSGPAIIGADFDTLQKISKHPISFYYENEIQVTYPVLETRTLD